MSRYPRKLLGLFQTLGFWLLLAWVVRRAWTALYQRRRELLIVKRLRAVAPAGPTEPGLRIEPITAAHAGLLRTFNARYRNGAKAVASAAYLRNGYEGFLAFVDDRLVGYWWWVSAATDPALTHPCVERFDLPLGPGEIFAFDYFVMPECRERGVAVKFLTLIYAELTRRGYRTVWGSVDADNLAARWVYRLVGNGVVRETVSHELASMLLFQDRRVFVRNTRWNRTHPFERRVLVARSPQTHRVPKHEIAPESLSARGV